MLEKRAVTAGQFKGASRSANLWLTSTDLFKCQWTDEHNNSRHKLAVATRANYRNAHSQISSRSFSLTTRYLLAFLPWSSWVANFPELLAIFQHYNREQSFVGLHIQPSKDCEGYSRSQRNMLCLKSCFYGTYVLEYWLCLRCFF